MTTNFEGSARQRRGWLSRLAGGDPRMSREDIERDAAAQLGMPVDPPQESPEVAEAPAEADEHSEPAVATAGRDERGAGGVKGWFRGLVATEPAAARRERLEREAAAELGVQQQSEQPVG